MDQVIINWILAGASGVMGFLLNALWQAVKDLHETDEKLAEKVSHIEILVAGSYVKKSDFDKVMEALFLKLDRIEEKIDRKADKQ